MNLSNRLTFSLIFSVVLVALFALAATPALAITTVTAQVTEVVANDSTAGSVVRGKKVVTIKYSENADPAPVITAADDTNTPADDDTDPDVLAVTKVDGKTYTLTFLGAADGTSAATIPAITLTGYAELTGLDGDAADADARPFVLNDDTLAGKGYAIIATYYARTAEGGVGDQISSSNGAAVDVSTSTTGSFPTLPTSTADPIIRRDWNDHFDDADASDDLMPDLWAHFQAGHRGTLDLTVTDDGMDPADDAGNRVGGVNARTVRINEVMWARDESQVGGLGYTREQWIEIYNTKTTPVAFANIRFTLSNAHPAPTNASTDRLSTYPSFTSVWDITGKGQDGHPGAADGSGRKEFASMHRTNAGDGWNANHWGKAGDLFIPNFRGTPGTRNSLPGLPTARTKPGATNPPKNKIIINEIGKFAAANADWIELRNVTSSDQPLKNYSLTITTGYNNETEIYDFPEKFNDIPVVIPANGVLLLLNSDPSDNDHARGFNIAKTAEFQDHGVNAMSHRYLVIPGNKIAIPPDDKWLLILRTHHDNKFHQSSHQIHDVAGPGGGHPNFTITGELTKVVPARDKNSGGALNKGAIWHTKVFPLNGQHGDTGNNNGLLRQNATILKADGSVWVRRYDKGGGQGWKHEAFAKVGFTGIGYDRSATRSDENGGTPGYPNDTQKGKVGDIADGKVIISELMLTQGRRARDPQWIELYNTSKTKTVQLDADTGWRLIIENHDSGQWAGESNLVRTINFKAKDDVKRILPNQTILVVSTTSARTSRTPGDKSLFPAHRVYDVYTHNRGEFYMDNRNAPFLNTNGFYIKLVDGKGTVSDEVGNLDGNARTYDDPPAGSWHWPAELTADDARTSLIRIMDGGTRGMPGGMMGTIGTPRSGTPVRAVEDDPETADVDETVAADLMRGAVLPMGSKVWRGKNKTDMGTDMQLSSGESLKYAWVHADDTGFSDTINTYYGSSTDIGTPGHITGKPLPVSLSFFRPTLEDGKVVIRWTTESELDNAGFNILRSDTRNGEFTQVNEQLIQGKGTTAERSTYKWVDTSAKPGAIYYYQIEDVSFAGERSTLTTTKLKGLISAKNKLTTTWSELKSQN